MNIRNFTAHPLCFYRQEDTYYVQDIRKHVLINGREPYLIVPSEGMLSIHLESELLYSDVVPIYRQLYSHIDRLPLVQPDDYIVVSAMFASHRKVADSIPVDYPLYTIKDSVYNRENKIVGCLGLNEV
jgi:hypothetical protein